MKSLLAAIALLSIISCGKHQSPPPNQYPPIYPTPNEAGVVIKGTATLNLAMDKSSRGMRILANGSQPVTVVVAPSTTFALDNSQFKVPTITPAVLNFGSLAVTTLNDNNLYLCGPSGTAHCGTAFIRVYTKDVAGPGLWNAAGGYGAPLTSTLGTPLSVGLNVAGAAIMQSLVMPVDKNVVHLNDFGTSSRYTMNFDFSNAGAGSYSTTIVVEYALAP